MSSYIVFSFARKFHVSVMHAQSLHYAGVPLVLGSLTHDYTGTPCVGDVVSLTCTLPGVSLDWDVPDPTRNIQISASTEPFQRDQYSVTVVIFNSTISIITSSLSFPAANGITIGCFPILQTDLREELIILTASETPLAWAFYNAWINGNYPV